VAFFDTKPAISLKRSGLEPKLLQSICRNSCTAYRLVTNLVIWTLAYFFRGKIFDNGYLTHYLSERDKIWQRWGSGQSKVLPQISWTLVLGVPWYNAETCISATEVFWHSGALQIGLLLLLLLSVLRWYTSKVGFRHWTSLCLPIV